MKRVVLFDPVHHEDGLDGDDRADRAEHVYDEIAVVLLVRRVYPQHVVEFSHMVHFIFQKTIEYH